MVKIKHLLFVLAGLFLLLGVVFYFTSHFWFEQFQAYQRGTIEMAAQKYGYNLSTLIDRVELSVLGTNSSVTLKGFPSHYGSLTYSSITFQKVLVGEDAREFCDKWSRMTFSWLFSGLCHEPAYGLRFFEKNNLVFETTLCWKCSNFEVPTSVGYRFCGFDSSNTNAQAMWQVLQKHAPLPGTNSPSK